VTDRPTACPECRDTGFKIEERDGLHLAVRCECRRTKNHDALLRASRIPPRYMHCTVENFEIWEPAPLDHLQRQARSHTREFIDCYPAVDKGLLFMGGVGTGKTHLAVAALQELTRTKGVHGLYVNALDLVQQLQMSFDGSGPGREAILAPVTEADLLVLDELGAGKLSEWVRDLLYYVINSRYMAKRVTVCTANDLDGPQASVRRGPVELASHGPTDATDLGGTSYGPESLADRISLRLRSRLYEMCEVIELRGDDYRACRLAAPGRRP
jgi:DNA replication protein DnaC